MADNKKIKVTKNGPYMVYGRTPLYDENFKIDAMGKPKAWEKGKTYNPDEIYLLCRCGKSSSMPFCSGNHTSGFDGTETAVNEPYETSCKRHEGCDGVVLLEKPILCTGAGYCHAGKKIEANIKKEKNLETAKQQTFDCPGGSLTLVINGELIEPELNREIAITTDQGRYGPIWVKGGIPVISGSGEQYEIRNRVALCRCGKSKNKPFCDAAHLD